MPASAFVHDAFYAVSGRLFAALEVAGEQLSVDSIIVAEEGLKWLILDSDVKVDRKYLDLLREKAGDAACLYELQPIGHRKMPATGQVLTLVMPLQFSFAHTLPLNCQQSPLLISGEDSRLYGMEDYLIGWEGEECMATYAIRYETHVGPFKQACLIDSVLGVGHEAHFYLYDTTSNNTRLRLPMQWYFGRLYVSDGHFFIADSQGLYCVAPSGELIWKNNQLGIDGVVISRFEDKRIYGEGEWDPPGGWRPFVLDSHTGTFLV